MRKFVVTLTVFASFLAAPVHSQSTDTVEISVQTSSGTNTYAASVVGMTPVMLETAMQSAGIEYTVSWFPSVPGYAVMILDGDPMTTTGKFGVPFWWACVNGFSSAAGLQTLVKSGDSVTWELVSDGKCPNDPAN